MMFDKIWGRRNKDMEEDEAYVDFNKIMDEPKTTTGKTQIKIEKLIEYRDTDKIQKLVREGCIVIADTEELKSKDIGELKRAIERIRKTIVALDGDIVMGPSSMLIICPSSVVVSRLKE